MWLRNHPMFVLTAHQSSVRLFQTKQTARSVQIHGEHFREVLQKKIARCTETLLAGSTKLSTEEAPCEMFGRTFWIDIEKTFGTALKQSGDMATRQNIVIRRIPFLCRQARCCVGLCASDFFFARALDRGAKKHLACAPIFVIGP